MSYFEKFNLNESRTVENESPSWPFGSRFYNLIDEGD